MKDRIWMVALLVIIGAISSIMLNAIYTYTAPIVAYNREVKLKKAVLEVSGIPYRDEAAGGSKEVEAVFDARVQVDRVGALTLYISYGDQGSASEATRKPTGVAFEVSGSGFWAPISALIALEPDLVTITGVKILEQADTPGLGGRIVEPWFQEQFKGKVINRKGGKLFSVVPYRDAQGPHEVDAITGATETSRAFDRIINTGMAALYAAAPSVVRK